MADDDPETGKGPWGIRAEPIDAKTGKPRKGKAEWVLDLDGADFEPLLFDNPREAERERVMYAAFNQWWDYQVKEYHDE